MNKIKNEKGITLVSLVVTIVILSIIATITITTSIVGDELIVETLDTTKTAQIRKYIELIEITRQEALSREYVLEMNNESVIHEMYDIMTNDYADKAYRDAEIIPVPDEANIKSINLTTEEGYVFNITKEETHEQEQN